MSYTYLAEKKNVQSDIEESSVCSEDTSAAAWQKEDGEAAENKV